MLSAKLTSKGQITIPKKVREKIGINPGDELQFREENGIYYIKKGVKKSPFDRWVGYLKSGQEKSSDTIIEEMRGK